MPPLHDTVNSMWILSLLLSAMWEVATSFFYSSASAAPTQLQIVSGNVSPTKTALTIAIESLPTKQVVGPIL